MVQMESSILKLLAQIIARDFDQENNAFLEFLTQSAGIFHHFAECCEKQQVSSLVLPASLR